MAGVFVVFVVLFISFLLFLFCHCIIRSATPTGIMGMIDSYYSIRSQEHEAKKTKQNKTNQNVMVGMKRRLLPNLFICPASQLAT